ncbi:MAG: ELM1/GtrOC1 family putative glycosyltransferase [bacterium]
MRKLLIVTDGKAGHENQSKAFCSALGYGYDCVRVAYPTRFHKAFSYVADRLGLLSERLFTSGQTNGYYAAVVCAGSTAFYPGKVTARRRGIPVAAILFPGGYKLDFDCILAPVFDCPPQQPNILAVPVNLASTNEAFYEAEIAVFLSRHTQRKPAVALIVGGPNTFASMKAETMRRDLDRLFAATEGRERWVTTSRRTPAEVEALIDGYPFDYKLIYSRDPFNPIPAFVSLCERLFVTADSTGMISEAVTRGTASVEILMNLNPKASKFARFVQNLAQENAVHVFAGSLGSASHKVDLTPAFEQARQLLKL